MFFRMLVVFCLFFVASASPQTVSPATEFELGQALAGFKKIINNLPPTESLEPAIEKATADATTATTTAPVPSRARSNSIRQSTSASPDPAFPKAILSCAGWRIRPSKDEVLEPRLTAHENLGYIMVIQDLTPLSQLLLSARPPRSLSRKVVRTYLQAYDEVSLGKYTFNFNDAGLYDLRVTIIADDPVDRRVIGELHHPVLVEIFSSDDIQTGAPLPPRVRDANANYGFGTDQDGRQTWEVTSLTITGDVFSEEVAGQEQITQHLLIPGLMEMPLKLKNNGYVSSRTGKYLPGLYDVVLATTDRYSRVWYYTLSQALLIRPGLPVIVIGK